MREVLGKSRAAVFSRRKVGSLKRRLRSHVLRADIKDRTPLWREAYFQVKMYTTHHSPTTFWSADVQKWLAAAARSACVSQNVQNTAFSDHFWSSDVEKSHAAVARSTFASQNVKKRTGPEHFFKFTCRELHAAHFQKVKKRTVWGHFFKFRCRKIARHCGAKRVSKSKYTRHRILGQLFWSSDVENWNAAVAPSTFTSQNAQNTCVWRSFGGFDVAKVSDRRDR